MKGKAGTCPVVDCGSRSDPKKTGGLCTACYRRFMDKHVELSKFCKTARWGHYKVPAKQIGEFFQWRCLGCASPIGLSRSLVPSKLKVACCGKTWTLIPETNT